MPEQKKEAFHLPPVVSKSPLKTNKILWSFFPLWKSSINILQQMIIDFYKAIYRLLKSWLFNPLGARKEEFSEVGIIFSFPHQHSQNLQTSGFWFVFFFAPRIFLLLLMLQCSSTGLILLFSPTWDRFFSWSVLEVYCLSDIYPLLTAGGLDAQQSRLCVRKSAAAHISQWSLAEDHSGPLPTAPCYGKRKAIKP